MEVGRMPYKWPAETDFALWELDVIDRFESAEHPANVRR
jgi:hypothetical protein